MNAGRRILLIALITLCSTGAYAQDSEDRGIDNSAFDKAVRPQDDLYLAVNGTWLDQTEIPADKSNYGSFIALMDEAQEQIRDIIESAADSGAETGSDTQKVGDFYKSFMDTRRVEQLGVSPLRDEIAQINQLASHDDVIRHFGYLKRRGVASPIGFFVTVDAKNSARYLSAVMQSGTTLPDRDYYLKDDEKSLHARQSLKHYIQTLFALAGFAEEVDYSDEIVGLEKQLAEIQWTRTQLRDANKRYNLYPVSDLGELAEFPWEDFFGAADVGHITEVNVMTPSFFEALQAIVEQTPVEIWQKYLQFKLLDAYAPVLSKGFVDAHFELHQKVLADVPEQKPRWKRAVATIAGEGAGDFGALGEVVGRLYVERHFPPENKAAMDQLVNNLLEAYQSSIDELTWMTDVTKQRAQDKLAKITTKIGYPEKWKDYDKLEVKPDDLFGNVQRSMSVEYDRMIEKLGKPVDRTEWGMTPQTVNAYYNPTMNEIVFPAAILQPPFFNVAADDAVNYGGIGAVIGHEISHAFDDQGSKYDGDGNLNNWWTDEDRESFRKLTERLIAQYAQYEPLPGRNVNGELTLGENIADLSGLSIAYKAYQISLQGEPAPEIAGWTGNQRFFLGWSQVWRRKYRDAEMVRRLLIDPHAPSWYRANGPVTNIDAFYEAFDVRPGDKLYKPADERIRIW